MSLLCLSTWIIAHRHIYTYKHTSNAHFFLITCSKTKKRTKDRNKHNSHSSRQAQKKHEIRSTSSLQLPFSHTNPPLFRFLSFFLYFLSSSSSFPSLSLYNHHCLPPLILTLSSSYSYSCTHSFSLPLPCHLLPSLLPPPLTFTPSFVFSSTHLRPCYNV